MVKWARRHPAFLAFGFILLAVIATGLAIGSTLLARKQVEVTRQRDRANELAGVADSQRDRAEQNARLARRAVDEMFTQVAEKWLADQPRLEPVQQEFLEKALRFYEQFSRQEDANPAARRAVADAWQRVGEIRLKLGMLGPAEQAIRRCVAIKLALVHASRDDPEARYQAAMPYASLAELLFAGGKLHEAADAYRRMEEIARTLTDGTSGPLPYREALADALGGLGLIHSRLGRPVEAERDVSQAITIQEKCVVEDPQDQRLRSTLANNLNNLSVALLQSGRLEEARAICRRAMDSRQHLLDQSPGSKEWQDDLAMSIANLGAVCYLAKELGQAETLYRRVLPIRRKLVADFPRVPDYRKRLADDLNNLAEVLRNSGRPREAEPYYREAVVALEGLVRDFPDLAENRTSLGDGLYNLGVLLRDVGRKDKAEAAYRRAMETLEAMVAEHPEVPAPSIRFLECALDRGAILLDIGRTAEAEAVFRRAIDLSDRAAARAPTIAALTEPRSRLLKTFGEFLKRQHRDTEARDVLRRPFVRRRDEATTPSGRVAPAMALKKEDGAKQIPKP